MGGPWFRDDAHTVRLRDLGLRPRERFSYEYNFFAGWHVDLRVERIRPAELGKSYPRRTGGRRAGPPEDWGGPWEFQERTQPRLVFSALLRAAEIMGQLLDADGDDQLAHVIGADRDELAELAPLLGLELFERKACDQALATHAAAVNQVISKRMVKKQQMRWTPRGAHLLLQIRTRVLNDQLADDFCRWYPNLTRAPDTRTLAA